VRAARYRSDGDENDSSLICVDETVSDDEEAVMRSEILLFFSLQEKNQKNRPFWMPDVFFEACFG